MCSCCPCAVYSMGLPHMLLAASAAKWGSASLRCSHARSQCCFYMMLTSVAPYCRAVSDKSSSSRCPSGLPGAISSKNCRQSERRQQVNLSFTDGCYTHEMHTLHSSSIIRAHIRICTHSTAAAALLGCQPCHGLKTAETASRV
jgi:hypothetical protein